MKKNTKKFHVCWYLELQLGELVRLIINPNLTQVKK